MRAQEEIEQRILEMQETLTRLVDDARNKRLLTLTTALVGDLERQAKLLREAARRPRSSCRSCSTDIRLSHPDRPVRSRRPCCKHDTRTVSVLLPRLLLSHDCTSLDGLDADRADVGAVSADEGDAGF